MSAVTKRTLPPLLSRDAALRAVTAAAVPRGDRKAQDWPRKPGRSAARVIDREIAKRMPSTRRRVARWQMAARVYGATRVEGQR